jgi:hypothetical protein
MGREVLFLGSMGLNDAEEVFLSVARFVGDRLRRIPDGETGNARSYWIQCQTPFFMDHPLLEMVEPDPDKPGSYRHARIPSAGLYSPTMARAYRGQARLRPGVSAADVHFDNFGYADWAIESFAVFKRLKQAGAIPARVRFQVCIPTTHVLLQARILASDRDKIGPAYEAAIFREVERMASVIPVEELAVQWDCTEPPRYEDAGAEERSTILERMTEFSRHVPVGVELGYHLCYGDWEHRHPRDPVDAGAMVAMANALAERVQRPIDWLHVPVPRDRSDDAYFAPLRDLRLQPATKLFLGLVHYTDGVEGTRKRMQAADRFVSDYGIATECGLGRRVNQDIPELLRIHQQAADLPA